MPHSSSLTEPRVAVLMPTRDRPAFLHRAIEMFLEQTWRRKELLIIDEPSSSSWGRAWEKQGPHVAVLGMPGTIGAKLNFAAQSTGADILVRFDDDDFQHPYRIEAQVRHLEISGAQVVGLSSCVYYREGEPYGWEYTGDACYATGGTLAYGRRWALRHPFPDSSRGEDGVFVAEARQAGALSTLSGTHLVVASNHAGNSIPRFSAEEPLVRFFGIPDQFRKVDFNQFAGTVARWIQPRDIT